MGPVSPGLLLTQRDCSWVSAPSAAGSEPLSPEEDMWMVTMLLPEQATSAATASSLVSVSTHAHGLLRSLAQTEPTPALS